MTACEWPVGLAEAMIPVHLLDMTGELESLIGVLVAALVVATLGIVLHDHSRFPARYGSRARARCLERDVPLLQCLDQVDRHGLEHCGRGYHLPELGEVQLD